MTVSVAVCAVVALLIVVAYVLRNHGRSSKASRASASIDDPIGKAQQSLDATADPAPTVAVLQMIVATFDPVAKVAVALRSSFSAAAREERTRIMIASLVDAVRDNEAAIERLQSSEYLDALVAGYVESTINTTDPKMIKRFGLILARSAASPTPTAARDAASFIRDLSRLTELEVDVMRILEKASQGIQPDPDPNRYTERFAALMTSVQGVGIDRDDFYSCCLKLGGFGLVLEVQRNTSRMTPADHCFRLTSRGRTLLGFIREGGASVQDRVEGARQG